MDFLDSAHRLALIIHLLHIPADLLAVGASLSPSIIAPVPDTQMMVNIPQAGDSISVVLAIVAAWLAYESRSLLIGETADRELVTDVQKLVEGAPDVAKARRPLTMQLDPRQILLCLDVQFRPDIRADELIQVVDGIERKIRQEHPSVGQIFIEIERLKKFQPREAA